MTQSISAAIHIQGPTIRCAEIGREDSALQLRRLDSKTVDLNGGGVLWDADGAPDALDRVGAFAQDALEGTEALATALIIHPLEVYSFFVPIPTGLSEQERGQRVAYQAALVTNTRSPNALHTTSRSVRTVETRGETVEWVHVLAVPQAVEELLDTLRPALPVQDLVQMVSTEAVASLMGRADTEELLPAENEEGYGLAIGHYPTYTEYALTHEGTWFHAHAVREARRPKNQAYYAVGLLNRIGVPVNEVRGLFVYGPGADAAASGPLETIFDCSPVSLDPFGVLHWASERPRDEAPGAYAPCIGGALGIQSA